MWILIQEWGMTNRLGSLGIRGQKQKRVNDYSYHKEKMMMCKQEEKGVPLSAEQSDWLHDTNDSRIIKKWKHITRTWQRFKSNVIPDHSDICNNDFEDDHNVDDNDEDECVELANLIANLKLDIDENKKIQKQLMKANATLTHELNESKFALTKSNDILDRCRSALHQKEVELEKYITYKNYQLEKEEIEHKYKETLDLLAHQKHQSHEAL
ncbi:hypothetical protein Tco_1557301 [Tanacetum coccineum]